MSGVSDRIDAIIRESGLSVRGFADELGVSNVTVYKWKNGSATPKGQQLEKLCQFAKVPPSWILYGDGTTPHAQSIAVDDDTISIPVLDVNAACGIHGFNEGVVTLVRMIRVTLDFLRQFAPKANARGLHIVTAVGDSMEPTICSGDVVLVDSMDTKISGDGIYAIQYENGILLKRVQCNPPAGVILHSDNKLYPPLKIDDTSSLNIVGKCYVGVCFKSLG